MRRHILFTAFFAAMGSVPFMAAELEESQLPSYREDQQRRPRNTRNPLRFKAPSSQLLDPWRCSAGDIYVRPLATWRCAYDSGLGSDYLLDYPFATLPLMPPLRPVSIRSLSDDPLSGGPGPGSPPSQLPNNGAR